VAVLNNGLKRIVNHYAGPAPAPRVSAPSAFEPREEDPPDSLATSPRLSPRLRVSAPKNEPASNRRPR
jgi:hypothetical protein